MARNKEAEHLYITGAAAASAPEYYKSALQLGRVNQLALHGEHFPPTKMDVTQNFAGHEGTATVRVRVALDTIAGAKK